MVAVAQYMPADPREQASVRAVLREHPELPEFILRVSAKADELFPGARITLDTVRHDDWDPPVRMLIWAPLPLARYLAQRDRLVAWLRSSEDYDRDLIFVFPRFAGDPDEDL